MKLRRGGRWTKSPTNDEDITNDDFLLPDEEFPESAFMEASVMDNGSTLDRPLLQNSDAVVDSKPANWFRPWNPNHTANSPRLVSAESVSFRKSDDLSDFGDAAFSAANDEPPVKPFSTGFRIVGVAEPAIVRKEVRFSNDEDIVDFPESTKTDIDEFPFFPEMTTTIPIMGRLSPNTHRHDEGDLVYSPQVDVPDVLENSRNVVDDIGTPSLADYQEAEEQIRPLDVQLVTAMLRAAHQTDLKAKQKKEKAKHKFNQRTSEPSLAVSSKRGVRKKKRKMKPQKEKRQQKQRPSATDSVTSGIFPRGVLRKGGRNKGPDNAAAKATATAAAATATIAATVSPAAPADATIVKTLTKQRSGRSFRDVLRQTLTSYGEEETNSLVKSESSGERMIGDPEGNDEATKQPKNLLQRSLRNKQKNSTKDMNSTKAMPKQRSWSKRLPSFEHGLFRRGKRKTKTLATPEAANTLTRDSSTAKSSISSQSELEAISDDDGHDPGIAGMIARALGDPWEEDSIEEYTEESTSRAFFRRRADDTVSYSASSVASSYGSDDSEDFANDLRSAMDDFLDSSCTCCSPSNPK